MFLLLRSARRACLSPEQVSRIRARFVRGGVDGLADRAKAGRKDHAVAADVIERVVQLALSPPPAGRSRWTSRLLGREVRRPGATVARILRNNGLKPHLVRAYQVSRDPEFLSEPAGERRRAEHRRKDLHSGARTHTASATAAHGAGDAPFAMTTSDTGSSTCTPPSISPQGKSRIRARRVTRGRFPVVHEEGRSRQPPPRAPRRARQLVDAWDARRHRVARKESTDSLPLHAHQRILAEPGRGLLRHPVQAISERHELSNISTRTWPVGMTTPHRSGGPSPPRPSFEATGRMLDRISVAVH